MAQCGCTILGTRGVCTVLSVTAVSHVTVWSICHPPNSAAYSCLVIQLHGVGSELLFFFSASVL
jgi:hypothetical protein